MNNYNIKYIVDNASFSALLNIYYAFPIDTYLDFENGFLHSDYLTYSMNPFTVYL